MLNVIAFEPLIFLTFVTGVPEPILAEPPLVPLLAQVDTVLFEPLIVVVSAASNQNDKPPNVKGKAVTVLTVPPSPLDTE